MLQIIINSDTIDQNSPRKLYSAIEAAEPHLQILNSSSDKLYTVIILDYNSVKPPYLHLLVTNIPKNDIIQGTVVQPFSKFSPPVTDSPHEYHFYLLEQEQPLNNIPQQLVNNFNLDRFRKKYNLQEVDEVVIEVVHDKNNKKTSWFKPGLTEKQEKYCSCVLEVAAKQPGACNLEEAWFEQRDDNTSYNPYAVCAKSVGTSFRDCGQYYNYDQLPSQLNKAYANLKGLSTMGLSTKEVIEKIYKWKQDEGKNN